MTDERHEPFDPDWTVHPGATLKDWRAENGLSERVAATACDMWPSLYAGIEAGEVEIDWTLATVLGYATGVPVRFWWNRERQFRADLAAGRQWVQ